MKKEISLLIILSLLLISFSCKDSYIFKSNLESMPTILDVSFYDNIHVYSSISNYPKSKEIQSIVNDAVANGLPGVVVLIDDQLYGTYVYSNGLIDIKNNIPIKNNSISRIGSITKMFTSVVIMQLYQENKLSLDDVIIKYLPYDIYSNIENAKLITIRHLLNHSSGIFNYTDLIDPIKYYKLGNNIDTTTLNSLKLIYGKSSYFKPGTKYHYTNTGYLLLGLIIEKITNKTLKEVFEERIFNPLKLNSTEYNPDNPFPKILARGYVDLYNDHNFIDCTYFEHGCRTPDGGITSNVFDLSVFIKAIFNDERLISKSTLNKMIADMIDVPEFGTKSGLGIFREDLPDNVTMYGHSGGHYSYSAELLYFPDLKITIACMVNTSRQFGNSKIVYSDLIKKLIGLIIYK